MLKTCLEAGSNSQVSSVPGSLMEGPGVCSTWDLQNHTLFGGSYGAQAEPGELIAQRFGSVPG